MGNTQSADDGDGGSEHASYGDSVFFGSYSSPNRALPPSDSSSSSKKEGGQQRVEQRASSPPITTPDPPADESSLNPVNSHDNLLRATSRSSPCPTSTPPPLSSPPPPPEMELSASIGADRGNSSGASVPVRFRCCSWHCED